MIRRSAQGGVQSVAKNVVTLRAMWACALALPALAPVAPAGAADVTEGLRFGQRLRIETVDQNNALDKADAITLRTVLGYEWGAATGVSAYAEFENIVALRDRYAPETPGYSTVADPEDSQLNEAVLRYRHAGGLSLVAGRHQYILDNARWVGNVGWRQNEQTFDGAFLAYQPNDRLTLNYAYLAVVNTIVGTRVDLGGHLLNATWSLSPKLTLGAYAYLLDYDEATATDFDTLGASIAGKLPLRDGLSLGYRAEYARQQASVPGNLLAPGTDHETDYLAAELGLGLGDVTFTLGTERLGSDDGDFALQTPLATKHAFNGWADAFLSTPAHGLVDVYLRAQQKIRTLLIAATYHEFSADQAVDTLIQTVDDYGREFDVLAKAPLKGSLSGLVKFARYRAQGHGVDTTKIWLQLEYKL